MMRELPQLQRAALLSALLAVAVPGAAAELAITNVDLYPAPDAARIDAATIIIRDGRVVRVGAGLDTADLPVLDGKGGVATAGLWNCHVHFTDPELSTDAALVLRDMLLRYGFTSVVDTGSVLSDTQRLAAAIEAGRLEGPRIITASGSLVYTDGTPSYLPGIKLPEVASAAAATPMVNSVLDAGADGIKIFSGSFQASRPTVLLPPDVIAAITAAAHARGSFVVSHPTDLPGLMNAVQNGVDVLAHTAPAAGALGPEVIDTMLAAGVALIPTLKLWSWELGRGGAPEAALRAFQNAGVDQLRAYSAAGGEILFGTDVGYMRDYDTTEELEMMRRAGLTFRDILASLTTNPARRFAAESGVVEPGAPGDLVIFAADPTDDPTVLSNVRYTVRGGRIAYDALR